MDLSKIFWCVVIGVILLAGWLMTTSGMEKIYQNATKNLVGNDPDQDIIDEATLSKYGGLQQSMFRYENAKLFYTTSIDRYGMDGQNYWANLHQVARCELKLENDLEALKIFYDLWLDNAHLEDKRVPSRNVLKSRIQQLIELNDLQEYNYPMKE